MEDAEANVLLDQPTAAAACAIVNLAASPSAKAQAEAVNALGAALSLACGPSSTGSAVRGLACIELCSELLLASNSKPMHRPLLATLSALPQPCLAAAHAYLAARLAEEACSDGNAASIDSHATRCAALAQAATSLLAATEHRPVVAPCAAGLAQCMAREAQVAVQRASSDASTG